MSPAGEPIVGLHLASALAAALLAAPLPVPHVAASLEAPAPEKRDPQMRAFWKMVDRHAPHQPLGGMGLGGIQHLLASTGDLLRGAVRAGVQRAKTVIGGKAYSEMRRVTWELKREGFRIIPGMVDLRRLELDYPGYFDKPIVWGFLGASPAEAEHYDFFPSRIVNQLKQLPDDGTKLLVLDDGGQLLKLINEEAPELTSRVVGVEQTRKGILELKKLKLKFPVISVGEAWAKLVFESPMIGRSVGLAVEAKVKELTRLGVNPGRRVTLFGYGAVGRATAEYLRSQGLEVEIYDSDPTKRTNAITDGFHALSSHKEAVATARIAVNATPGTPLSADDLEDLPDGAVLMNAGSGNDAFQTRPEMYQDPHRREDNKRFISRFRGVEIELTRRFTKLRDNTVLRTRGGKELLLAKDGNVINFQYERGNYDPIPGRYIQLTRGLLYLALVQGAHTKKAGLHALALKPQRRLVADIEAQLRESGESLLAPRF
jgi:hypothetical protein